jgi:crotonobetainyl-CoA:carnitine CoA-transferase CaiB-like acyl-CoA transferase
MAMVLEGIRVVELARYISGPYCGMLLADLGADVVKVETPGGDPTRFEGPWIGDESLYFAQMNRNKRGVVIDSRSEAGLAELTELLRTADILIENFRPGVIDAMGFGREALAELNPRCITVSVSGFGQESEMRDRTAFDCILQCLTGLAAINGRPGDFPMLTGAYIVDTVAALIATIGALAALQQRERTGVGQLVDVAMLDSALTLLGPVIPVAAATGEEPELVGNADRTSAPADAYRASDGWVYIHAGPDGFFTRIARAMGREDLLELDRFKDIVSRVANRAEVDAIVGGWVAQRTVAEVEAELAAAGVPASRVNSVVQAVNDTELQIRDRLVEVVGSNGVTIPALASPVRLSDSPTVLRHGVPGRG